MIRFGGPGKYTAKEFKGKWIIMKEEDYLIAFETRDSREHVTEIKWSGDRKKIAIGS